MAYISNEPRLTLAWYRACSCPFLFHGNRCAGGDYCSYPPGKDHLCCFFCPLFDSCPDRTGVCARLTK